MKQYLELIQRVLDEGVQKEDRTGTGTISVFGHQMRFDLSEGFPLLTTKKMFTRGIIEELLWFISGSTNKKILQEKNVHIWDSWGDDETGELGPIYGHQWRAWQDYDGGSIDQLMQAVETIKKNPDSRRIIVSSWNVAQIDQMGLPPCHCFFQFYVANGKLSLQLYQRSADIFLGVPFNIEMSYAYNEKSKVFMASKVEMVYADITLSANEMTQNTAFNLYPNPANGMISVNGEGFEKAEIYNIAGQKVMESNDNQIDVEALQAGVYMVKVFGNGSSEMLRVVVK